MKNLLHAIQQGDLTAFERFHGMYYDKLFKFAMHFVYSEEWSCEIVSDTFFAIWQNREQLTTINNIDGYLYATVKNKSLTYIAKYGDKNRQFVPIASVSYVFHESDTPESVLYKDEIETAIEQAIAALPPQCRVIFKLAYEDNLKYKQIADILQISVRTIDAQMRIARTKIRTALERHLQY